MKAKGNYLVNVLAVMLAAGSVAPAAAQDRGQTARSASGAEVEQVVVTATRREEKLSDIPFSVNALSGARLERMEINSISDLSRSAPEFRPTSSQSYRQNLSMRGAVDSSDAAGADHGVGVLIDDVPAIGHMDAVLQEGFFDADRVELLRGPQGTLFGRNVTGGVISLHSREPTQDPSGSVTLGLGNYKSYQARAVVNGPLSDNLAGRLALSLTGNEEGYANERFIGGTLGKNKSMFGRGQLLWTPNDKFSLLGGLTLSKNDGQNFFFQIYGNTQPGDVGVRTVKPGVYGAPGVYPQIDLDPRGANSPYSPKTTVDTQSGFVRAEWDAGEFGTLTSISGYRNADGIFNYPADGLPTNMFESSTRVGERQYSQEIRLASSEEMRLRYVFGALYLSGRRTYVAGPNFDCSAFAPVSIATSPALCFASTRSAFRAGQEGRNKWTFIQRQAVDMTSAALFGEVNFDITDQLTFTVGIRGTRDKRSGDSQKNFANQAIFTANGAPIGTFLGYTGQVAVPNAVPCNAPFLGRLCVTGGASPIPDGVAIIASDSAHGIATGTSVLDGTYSGDPGISAVYSDTWEAVTPRFSLRYKPSEQFMAYAQASRGYLSGGFDNRGASGAALATPFSPEFVWNYEVGLKTDLLENRLHIDLAVYQMDFTDKQVRTLVASCGCTVVSNAGAARSRGFELDVGARPTDWLTVGGSWARTDAKYISNVTSLGNFSGNKIPLTPKDAYNFYFDVKHDMANAGEIGFGANAQFSSAVWFADVNNDPAFLRNASEKNGLIDVYLNWTASNQDWEVRLYGKNITNEDVLENWQNLTAVHLPAVGVPADGRMGSPFWNAPATYGVNLTRRW